MSDLPPKIGSPAQRALAAAGITHLEQLSQISEPELLNLHGVGPKAVRILGEALAGKGLAFAALQESRSISEQANRRLPKHGVT